MTWVPAKIISGGQTGADQGALAAARYLGLETGGWMPKGWRTETGPCPEFEKLYSMMEHSSSKYSARTATNVALSDATLIFGDATSPGSQLTFNLCGVHHKRCWTIAWRPEILIRQITIESFQCWLDMHKPNILNVAGNRESKAKGIKAACQAFLITALNKDSQWRKS